MSMSPVAVALIMFIGAIAGLSLVYLAQLGAERGFLKVRRAD